MEKLTLRDAIDASNKLEKFLDTMFQYFESQRLIDKGYQSMKILDGSAMQITLSYGRSEKNIIFDKEIGERAFDIFTNGGASIMEFNELLDNLFKNSTKTTENAYKG